MHDSLLAQLQGILARLAEMLKSSSRDVQVRALLCLGMLMGDSPEQQVQLANIKGALPQLLELRLQKDDEDCRQIADGIVAAMVSCACCAALLQYGYSQLIDMGSHDLSSTGHMHGADLCMANSRLSV